jgi:lipopolysaccharide biosynthesis glycosyltransferase
MLPLKRAQTMNPHAGITPRTDEKQEYCRIAVCLASDEAYVQHLSVAIASILTNKNPADHLHFYILDGGISPGEKQKLASLKNIADFDIDYIDVTNLFRDQPTFALLEKKHLSKHISITSCYRLFIHELIPHEDKIIYMDCDLVVLQSLADLYKKESGKYLVFGVRDIASLLFGPRLGVHRYINSGVLLLDTKKMREQNVSTRIFQWMEDNLSRVLLGDQDIINGALDGDIGPLADKWNVQALRRRTRFSFQADPAIIHYIGAYKPWKETGMSRPHADEYFKYLALTPYNKPYREPLRRKIRNRIRRGLLYLVSPLFLRTRSIRETYNTFRIFGFSFKKKREFPKQ